MKAAMAFKSLLILACTLFVTAVFAADQNLIEAITQTQLNVASTLAAAINKNQACEMGTHRGEVLDILSRVY